MHDLTTLLAWLSKVSVESSVTPRTFNTSLTATLLPATDTRVSASDPALTAVKLIHVNQQKSIINQQVFVFYHDIYRYLCIIICIITLTLCTECCKTLSSNYSELWWICCSVYIFSHCRFDMVSIKLFNVHILHVIPHSQQSTASNIWKNSMINRSTAIIIDN